MIFATTALSALWLTWLSGWVVAALWTARTVARQSMASRLAHSVFFWAGASLLFFVRPTRSGILLTPLIPPAAWIEWGGIALTVLGLGFTVWARVHLGRYWSGTVTLKEGHTLVRSGPYALTRHPIYTGLLVALTGTAMARGTTAALLGYVLLVVGILLKSRQEERLLTGHFGAEYDAYRAEVPAVVPRVRMRA